MKFRPPPQLDTHHIQRDIHWRRRPAPKPLPVEKPLTHFSGHDIQVPPGIYWFDLVEANSIRRRMLKLCKRVMRV